MPFKMRVTIHRDGTITEDVLEAAGEQCLVEAQRLEERLGTIVSRTAKPEHYEVEVESEQVHEVGG
jgi:hypothetical protein